MIAVGIRTIDHRDFLLFSSFCLSLKKKPLFVPPSFLLNDVHSFVSFFLHFENFLVEV